jgi:hypothetical protein
MRNIKVLIEILYQRFLVNWNKYLVMVFTLALTISFLILTGHEIYNSASKFESLSLAKRTYVTRISSSNTIKALDTILQDWVKKEIETANKVSLYEKGNIYGNYIVYFSGNYTFLNPQSIESSILKGRPFNSTELENGEQVIILNQDDYLTYYRDFHLGDEIPIFNTKFKLIGISNYETVVPYNTILELSQDNKELSINEIWITTVKPLTNSEITSMIKHASNIVQDTEYEISSNFSSILTAKIENVTGSVIIALIICIICIANIIFNVKILILTNKNTTIIYVSLGYTRTNRIASLISEIVLMLIVSVSIALVIVNYLSPVIIDLTMI